MFLADHDGAPIRYILGAAAVAALAVGACAGEVETSTDASPVTSGH